MPEHNFAPRPREACNRPFRSIARTGKAGATPVRRTPASCSCSRSRCSGGAWSESYDRLWEAHTLRDERLPSFAGLSYLLWFGVIGAGSLLLTILVAGPVDRRLERAGQTVVTRFLLALDEVLVTSVIAFGLAGSFSVALAAILVTDAARSIATPLFDSWLNASIEDSSVRATVISVASQADAVGQCAEGPAIGAVANAFGIRTALVLGGLLLSPAVGLYARALRRGRAVPELADPAGA